MPEACTKQVQTCDGGEEQVGGNNENALEVSAVELAGRTLTATPRTVIRRLWRAANQQIAESERRIASSMDPEAEREARTLSLLGKLVRELSEIELPQPVRQPRKQKTDRQSIITFNGEMMHGDAVDINRFRAALAQDFERLQQQRPASAVAAAVEPH